MPKTASLAPTPKAISLGIINGKATKLITPAYPEAAKAIRASGSVNVSVVIDEEGNVITASAVSGHPLLRQSSEEAARASKFIPTILSGQKVKASGVIVYTFTAP
jgi:protein TonB